MNTFVTAAMFVALFMPFAMADSADECKCDFPTVIIGDFSTSQGFQGEFGFQSDLRVFATNSTLQGVHVMTYDDVPNNNGFVKFLKPNQDCLYYSDLEAASDVSQRWYSLDCVPEVSPSDDLVYHNVNEATCLPESITNVIDHSGTDMTVTYSNFHVATAAEAHEWEEFITNSLASC